MSIFYITAILILINKTDFIYEYLRFFIPKKWEFPLLIFAYETERAHYANILEYWKDKYSPNKTVSFFLKLITCPYCFGFWLSLFFALFAGLHNFAFFYVASLFLYFLIDKLTLRK